jgi:hypothetical protein
LIFGGVGSRFTFVFVFVYTMAVTSGKCTS